MILKNFLKFISPYILIIFTIYFIPNLTLFALLSGSIYFFFLLYEHLTQFDRFGDLYYKSGNEFYKITTGEDHKNSLDRKYIIATFFILIILAGCGIKTLIPNPIHSQFSDNEYDFTGK